MTSRRDSSELSPKTLELAMNERRADQPRRKRASKACLACRRRKVRCDVAQRGPPCMNCFLDKEDCVVKPRSTKYRVSKRDSISEAPQIQRNSSTNSSPEHSPRNSGSPTVQGSSSIQDILMGDARARLDRKPQDHDVQSRAGGSVKRQMSRVEEMKSSQGGPPGGMGDYSNANVFQNAATDLSYGASSIVNTHIMFSYYPFIKIGSMSKIAQQDVNYLEAQGCFRVPTRPMLDEFVREYFLHIHPILPVINERAFWYMYDDRDYNGPVKPHISLLVFHAMLFAASSFVSAGAIQKLGFSSNRAARASYYRRARLLFEFDIENGLIPMAQGTLLLSYFSPLRSQSKANTYWLGIAIGFAKQAEAHRYQTIPNVSHEERNTLKRLWWCCVLRDRILPLGVRKSVQISALDFDFNNRKPLVFEDFESEIEASQVYDARTKRALIQRLVALCELAITLTQVIIVLYPEKEAFAHLNQKDPQSAVRACKFELNTWFEKTTVKCLTSPGIAEAHESILLYTNLMYIYYHSAILALCNHEVLLATAGLTLGSVGTNGLAQIYNTRRQIEDAINGISENLKDLVHLKLTKYMPISIVAYAALPLVLHLLDVKLANTAFRTAKKQKRLNIYIESMKALRSQYDVTDGVSEIIGKMVEHISLDQQDTQGDTPSAHSDADMVSHASKSTDDPSVISDWGDVLMRQPKLYLRLAITMDLSMAKGEFPTDSDFPLFLQSSKLKAGAQFPPYSISMDDTKPPGHPHNGLENARTFSGGLDPASGDIADPSMAGTFDRHLAFTPNEIITPGGMEAMNFDPMGLELPMGFEAFDLEASSKRGFDFDFPFSTDNTPFPEPS